ncbi:MAG: flagellar basal body P-ring formation chaperone FlgA [Pseudomonadota bacterium]
MTRVLPLILFALFIGSASALAETVLAARTIRSHEVIAPIDLITSPAEVVGAFSDPADLAGLEARTTIYAGAPIHPESVGPAAIIERNQIVTLKYAQAGLFIATEGRAMGRAGIGDRLRVMNLASRAAVSGLVMADGTVRVTGSDAHGSGG